MDFVMFTKHLQGYEIPAIARALKEIGLNGADLCVRPGYPVNPENVSTALPEASRIFASEGLGISLVTTPGEFTRPDVEYAERLYEACGKSGVKHIKLGYWHWSPGMDYWEEVDKIHGHLEGFSELSRQYGVQTVVHNHSGRSMGLNSSSVMNLVRGFDSKLIGVFADPGHLSVCGEPIDMALNIVKSHLAVLAFKDLVRQATEKDGTVEWKIQVVRLGTGFGEWKTLLSTLRGMEYEGVVSFHSEYRNVPPESTIDLTKADVRFVRGLLAGL